MMARLPTCDELSEQDATRVEPHRAEFFPVEDVKLAELFGRRGWAPKVLCADLDLKSRSYQRYATEECGDTYLTHLQTKAAEDFGHEADILERLRQVSQGGLCILNLQPWQIIFKEGQAFLSRVSARQVHTAADCEENAAMTPDQLRDVNEGFRLLMLLTLSLSILTAFQDQPRGRSRAYWFATQGSDEAASRGSDDAWNDDASRSLLKEALVELADLAGWNLRDVKIEAKTRGRSLFDAATHLVSWDFQGRYRLYDDGAYVELGELIGERLTKRRWLNSNNWNGNWLWNWNPLRASCQAPELNANFIDKLEQGSPVASDVAA